MMKSLEFAKFKTATGIYDHQKNLLQALTYCTLTPMVLSNQYYPLLKNPNIVSFLSTLPFPESKLILLIP